MYRENWKFNCCLQDVAAYWHEGQEVSLLQRTAPQTHAFGTSVPRGATTFHYESRHLSWE